jgi:predicted dehydrogenase
MGSRVTRRTFHRAAAAATFGLTAAQMRRAYGANERIRLGFIGVGNRGAQLLTAFLTHTDMEVAAVCDVYQPYVARARERAPGAAAYEDFRKIIEHKGIDAVVIATPDQWHAIQTVDACDAGKDVYVEKPLSITVYEGRRMVEAARRNKRIVQVGTHRRSSDLYRQLVDQVAAGKLGKVTVGRAYRLSNMYPTGIGKMDVEEPPADLDWNMWLGPRPERPYQGNIAPYKFRWWTLYSSQAANWGVHYFDAIRWLTGDLAPASICAMGGRFAVDDDRTIPDTLEVTCQFPSGRLAIFGQYEASGNPIFPMSADVELRGTLGTAYISGRQYTLVPERGGQFQDRAPRMEPEEAVASGSNADLTAAHARNFLDCVRSRELPNADVEIGHRSTSISLLANISLATGDRLEWDAKAERITNNETANALLHYEYRKPWKLG